MTRPPVEAVECWFRCEGKAEPYVVAFDFHELAALAVQKVVGRIMAETNRECGVIVTGYSLCAKGQK